MLIFYDFNVRVKIIKVFFVRSFSNILCLSLLLDTFHKWLGNVHIFLGHINFEELLTFNSHERSYKYAVNYASLTLTLLTQRLEYML